jgi:hypothetical protein
MNLGVVNEISVHGNGIESKVYQIWYILGIFCVSSIGIHTSDTHVSMRKVEKNDVLKKVM